MSQRQHDAMLRTIALEKKIAKQAKCTIQCECGRWFLDANAHACHVRSQGKKGHAVFLTRKAPKEEPADWAIF